jgi:membrane-associated protease RseP (regulator of RpoE activity)
MTVSQLEDSPVNSGESSRQDLIGLVLVIAVLVGLGLWSFTLLLVVLSIIFFVFMHELGHFATARWTGMKATEFFIGFGPRIFSFRRGETEFGLKPILAGAYVRIIGMNNLDEVDPADEDRTYRKATYPRRVLVITAGSMMHFVMAIVLFFGYYAFVGEQRITEWSIDTPSPDSAAEAAGLVAGDQLVSIDGASIVDFDDLIAAVEPRAGETVTILIDRDGQSLAVEATLGERERAGVVTGFLGVGMSSDFVVVRDTESIGSAATRSVSEFPDRIGESLSGIGTFATNIGGYVDNVFTAPGNQQDIDLETRPVSVVGVADISSQIGRDAIYLLAMFNVFVGVFNLMPLLPLDGGHLAVATYERIRSRPGRRHEADVNKLLPLTYAVFVVMVLFGMGALWLDIANPIQL